MALAEYVLHDQQAWSTERIREAMHAGEERVVTLRQKLPDIGYWTAWIGPNGSTVTHADDPYGIDGRQAEIVKGERKRQT